MYHNLTLSDAELMTISKCLEIGPYGEVRPVVDSINAQLRAAKEREAAELLAESERNK